MGSTWTLAEVDRSRVLVEVPMGSWLGGSAGAYSEQPVEVAAGCVDVERMLNPSTEAGLLVGQTQL